jgi:hypothetical protein
VVISHYVTLPQRASDPGFTPDSGQIADHAHFREPQRLEQIGGNLVSARPGDTSSVGV